MDIWKAAPFPKPKPFLQANWLPLRAGPQYKGSENPCASERLSHFCLAKRNAKNVSTDVSFTYKKTIYFYLAKIILPRGHKFITIKYKPKPPC